MNDPVGEATVDAFRHEWGRIVASLIRFTGDWDLAEECAQDAFERAVKQWNRSGVPRNPGAWLTTVARNRALDRLRRSATESSKHGEMVLTSYPGESEQIDDSGIADDRLRLIFTCCHPALSLEAQVALTLRTLTGLTTAEIARAFLVPEETMAKRLVRAKAKIRHAAIPYRVPPGHLLPERTVAVLAVLYLLFNEGYSASSGPEVVRGDLCDEALRLGQLLTELMPDEPEALGLLALMLLHHARRAGRMTDGGELVALEDQDRALWRPEETARGETVLDAALRQGRPGPYQVQAAIAACHATARQAQDTDWAEIVVLYERLLQMMPTPVVELNRAVAVSMAVGPEAGLQRIEDSGLAGRLSGYHLYHATRADLLRRLGRYEEASSSYRQALALATSESDRKFLGRRIDECAGRALAAER